MPPRLIPIERQWQQLLATTSWRCSRGITNGLRTKRGAALRARRARARAGGWVRAVADIYLRTARRARRGVDARSSRYFMRHFSRGPRSKHNGDRA
jgi:hypothetical protein